MAELSLEWLPTVFPNCDDPSLAKISKRCYKEGVGRKATFDLCDSAGEDKLFRDPQLSAGQVLQARAYFQLERAKVKEAKAPKKPSQSSMKAQLQEELKIYRGPKSAAVQKEAQEPPKAFCPIISKADQNKIRYFVHFPLLFA